MSGLVYRAIYSDANLSHSKFKYIDKWRSKTGKWVYKYKKDATNDLDDLKTKLESKMAQYRGPIKKKARNNQRPSKGGWHDIGKDAALSQKEKYNQSVQGNTHTRLRKVTDSSGRTTTRREYKDIAEQKSVDRSLAQYNEIVKGNNKVKRFLMNFNDKYGPKYVSSLEGVDGEGKHYVVEYARNFLGDRPVSADVYTYTEQKKVKRQNTKRSGKYRNAVKHEHRKYVYSPSWYKRPEMGRS